MQRALLFLVFGLLCIGSLKGQIKIGDNPQTIDPASVLELESNSRVLVITRVNTAQMNAITPLPGAVVYNTDLQCVHYYDGTLWVNICEEVGGIPNLTTDPFVNANSTLVITNNGENNHIEVAPNSIRSAQIVDGGINGVDIQDNSIGQSKIGNDAVGRNEIAENAVGLEALDTDEVTLGTLTNTPGFITGADIVSSAPNNALTDNSGAFYDNTPVLDAISANSGNITTNTSAISTNATAISDHITNDGDLDDRNELTDLSFDSGSNILSLTRSDTGITVDLSGLNNSGSDSQNLNTNNNPGNIGIDNGNTITLNVNDGDFNPSNEIQTLTSPDGSVIITPTGPSNINYLLTVPPTAGADGSETIINPSPSVAVAGTGTTISPYILTVDGSETEINPGSNITITGNGTTATPYVINAASGTVADGSETIINPSATVTVAGTGTSADPYILTSAGGADGSETIINASPSVAVTGTGTAPSPYILTVDGSETIINSTPTVTVTGNGTIGSPYELTGAAGNPDAVDVSFTPYLSLLSTNTQSAIEELKDELNANIISGGGNPTDELQDLQINTTILTLTNPATVGNSIDLDPTFVTEAELTAFSVNDADFDPNNEIQAISSADGSVIITPVGVNDFDLSVPVSTDDQNIQGSILTGETLTIGIEGGNPQDVDLATFALDIDVAAAIAVSDAADGDTSDINELQDVTSADNSVTITQTGNDFDLSVVGGSDDQNIENLGLAGTTLTVGIEDGTAQTVELASLVGTDDQTAAEVTYDNTTSLLTATDTQAAIDELAATGGSDDQNIENLGLAGTTLTVGIEDGTAQTVELASLVGTDDQTAAEVTYDNTTSLLTATDTQAAIDELAATGGSDDQNIENLGLAGTTLTVGIEDGTAQTVELASLVGTDDQTAAEVTYDNTTSLLTATDTQAAIDELAATGGSDDQNIENLGLAGTTLTVGIEDGTAQTVELASLVGTDDQTAAEVTYDNTTSLLTATDTQAAIDELAATGGSDDQNIENLGLAGTTLTVGIEDGTAQTVELASLVGTDDQTAAEVTYDNTTSLLTATDTQAAIDELAATGGSDDQNIENLGLAGTTLTVGIEDGTAQTVELASLVGTDDQTAAEVTYDNTTSLLTATDTQAAIDELAATGGSSNLSNTDLTQTELNRTYQLTSVNHNLVFTGLGSIGIGNGANPPENKFHVAGAIRSEGILNSPGDENEPSYRFSDDIDTGIFSNAADEIGFSVGGIEALRIEEVANATNVIVNESLELDGVLSDINNTPGTAGQILSSTGAGVDWIDAPSTGGIIAMGKIEDDGTILKATPGVTTSGLGGIYVVSLNASLGLTDPHYIINATISSGSVNPKSIIISAQNTTGFTVNIIDNTSGSPVASAFFFTVTDL